MGIEDGHYRDVTVFVWRESNRNKKEICFRGRLDHPEDISENVDEKMVILKKRGVQAIMREPKRVKLSATNPMETAWRRFLTNPGKWDKSGKGALAVHSSH